MGEYRTMLQVSARLRDERALSIQTHFRDSWQQWTVGPTDAQTSFVIQNPSMAGESPNADRLLSSVNSPTSGRLIIRGCSM